MTSLYWLPNHPDWTDGMRSLRNASSVEAWPIVVELSRHRLDFIRTEQLARATTRMCGNAIPAELDAPAIRLAIMSSCTVEHLIPGIRIGGARRNLWIDVYTHFYGQYLQELEDAGSGLRRYKPTAILFSLDARHMLQGAAQARTSKDVDASIDAGISHLRRAWASARRLCSHVMQQSPIQVFPALIGSNEHRLPWSQRRLVAEIRSRLQRAADEDGVDLVAIGEAAEEHGLDAWYDETLWNRTKQEIHPSAGPMFGDLVARVLAARFGRASKCMVLDLDNTIWGGTIGDDGLAGIKLGQGSAVGEAHLALQRYAKELSSRGVLLAVCSKNDKATAMEPFDRHPDMILRASDIACFIANWHDKASNIKEIAATLNIGIDSLTFVDDNAFERNLVRRELPMVNVPELPDDPALYTRCIANAGCFEATTITAEDLSRTSLYATNQARTLSRKSETDLDGYLAGLQMELRWRPFDPLGLARVVQLVNKTNQFNLTTRRYSDSDITEVMSDEASIGLQMRLVDALGDNGMISVIIARPGSNATDVLEIETWLMSCRVLGRQVEIKALQILCDTALAKGYSSLLGVYRPTDRNGMVERHYSSLGFDHEGTDEASGATFWKMALSTFTPRNAPIRTVQELQ